MVAANIADVAPPEFAGHSVQEALAAAVFKQLNDLGAVGFHTASSCQAEVAFQWLIRANLDGL